MSKSLNTDQFNLFEATRTGTSETNAVKIVKNNSLSTVNKRLLGLYMDKHDKYLVKKTKTEIPINKDKNVR